MHNFWMTTLSLLATPGSALGALARFLLIRLSALIAFGWILYLSFRFVNGIDDDGTGGTCMPQRYGRKSPYPAASICSSGMNRNATPFMQ